MECHAVEMPADFILKASHADLTQSYSGNVSKLKSAVESGEIVLPEDGAYIKSKSESVKRGHAVYYLLKPGRKITGASTSQSAPRTKRVRVWQHRTKGSKTWERYLKYHADQLTMALEAREAGGKNATNKVVLKSVETGTGKRQYQVDISNIKKIDEPRDPDSVTKGEYGKQRIYDAVISLKWRYVRTFVQVVPITAASASESGQDSTTSPTPAATSTPVPRKRRRRRVWQYHDKEWKNYPPHQTAMLTAALKARNLGGPITVSLPAISTNKSAKVPREHLVNLKDIPPVFEQEVGEMPPRRHYGIQRQVGKLASWGRSNYVRSFEVYADDVEQPTPAGVESTRSAQRKWSTILESETEIPWLRARLLVVGEGRAGKTAFVRALRNLPFKHTESTAGIATSTLETTDMHNWVAMDCTEYEQAVARLVAQLFRAETKLQQVLDTQTTDASVIKRALKKAADAGLKLENSDVVLAAHELLDQALPEAAAPDSPREATDLNSNSPVSASVCPSVTPSRSSSTEESAQTEPSHSLLMKIASRRFKEAKSNMVMRFSGDNQSDMTLVVWDFGGQKVFHAMHTVLLNSLALYALVFRIPRLLDPETRPQTLRFIGHWFNSIAIQAPEAPVLIVGTHKDELENPEEDLKEAQQVVRDFLCGMFIAKTTPIISHIQRPSDLDWFFPVDNTTRIITEDGELAVCNGITLFRNKLEEAIRNDKRTVIGLDGRSTPYLNFRMPTRALMLLEMLKSGASHAAHGEAPSNRSVCSFEDVQKAAKGLRLDNSPNAIRYLLGIFSGLGAVTWFEDVHPDLVVLSPQWLINAMACLIREHNGEHAQLLNDLKHDENAITLFDEAHVRRGIFPVALLEYIWSSSKTIYKALRARPADIDALKHILVNFGLICRVRVQRESQHSPEECYVVPALLADPPQDRNPGSWIRELIEYYPGAEKCMCSWDFSESRWLPLHIFERLVGIVMVASRDVVHVFDVVMARGVADIRAGDAVLLLRLHAERWCITAQTVNYEDCPHASAWMLKLVRVGMRRLLRMFRVKVPHKVLIRTPKGNVEYSDLRRAHALVTTTDGHTMRAKELKRKWLPAVYDCKADCCTTKPRASTWTRSKAKSKKLARVSAPRTTSSFASASSSGTQTLSSKASKRSSSRRSSKTASSKSTSLAKSSSVIPTWTPDPPPSLTSDPTSSSSVSEIPPAKAAFSTFTAEPTSSAGKREASAAPSPRQRSASASGMPAVASGAPTRTAHAPSVMSLSATPAATKDSQECTSDPTSSTSIAPVSQNLHTWTPDPTSSTSAVGTPAPRSTSPPMTSDPTSSSSESPIIEFLKAAEPEPNTTVSAVPASTLPPNPPKLTAQQPQPTSGDKTLAVMTTVTTWTPDPTSSTSAKATPSLASTTAFTPDPTSSTSMTQSPSPLRPSPRHTGHSARGASASAARSPAFSPPTTAPPFTPQTIARGRVNFTNLQLLAAGGFGQVYKGTCTSKKFKHGSFALKRQSLYVQQPKNINDLIRRQKARLETVQREAKIYFSPALNTGKCPHLAMLFDIALVKHPDGSKEPLMVLAWADAHPHNTLRKWINAHRFAQVSELRTRLSFAIQMFSGLVQLHSSGHHNPNEHAGFVHQDLKPANILLYGQGSAPLRLAITDFGLSTSPGRHAKVADGTRSYRSPEQWRKVRALSPSRDMWAASLILTELFGRQKTVIARKKYNLLCKQFKNHESKKSVDVQQLVTFAQGISNAIAEDARQCEPALRSVMKRVIALTKRNFCLDAEIEGRIDSSQSRWNSFRCKNHLEHTWAHVFRELPWTQYYSQIPLPKRSLFESLPKNFRSSLYHDLMEDNILRMLLHRYRKIYREVSFGERAVVEREIESLRRQRRHAKRKRRMLQDKFIMHLAPCWRMPEYHWEYHSNRGIWQSSSSTTPTSPTPVQEPPHNPEDQAR